MTLLFKDIERKYVKKQETLMKMLNKRGVSITDQNLGQGVDMR
jgi:hypothetical protein